MFNIAKNNLDNVCLYGNSCWFLHSERLKNAEPEVSCNFCEQKFRTIGILREHMKKNHTQMVSICKNESNCKFGQSKCWFLHAHDIENALHNVKRTDSIENNEKRS